MKPTMCLLALLAATSIQCGKNNTPVATDQHHDHADNAPTDVVRLPQESRDIVEIEVAQATAKPSRLVLKAMGKIVAPQPQTAIVGYPYSARVGKVQVLIGDWVEKGQVLVTLESQEVGSAKSDFFKAIADLELAKLNFEREKQLMENEIGIQKDLLAAEAQYKIAQANREAVEKRLHILGFTEDQVKEIAETHQINPEISLYAPIAGKAVKIDAVLGSLIDQETEIMTIIDPSLLWVDAEIYERDIAKVKVGQKVEITVPAYPDEVFPGTVSYIGDLVDDQTRTITVRAEVDNKQFRLKPGMFASMVILLNGDGQTPSVPKAAVLEDSGQKIVFVKQDDDSFIRREVETGPIDGDFRQIEEGLQPGELVVIRGNHELKSKLHEEVLEAGHVH